MTPAEITNAMGRVRIMCILGGPGVGKGTHCKKLAEHFPPLEHLSVGDLLREEAKESNAEDRGIIHGAMKAGGLAPNERVQAVLEKHLLKHISRGKTCFLLDGFPRSMEQATAFKARGWTVNGVLHFHSSDDVMRARVRARAEIEGRLDDKDEIHEMRLKGFADQNPQIMSFYQSRHAFVRMVDCERDFEVVYEELPDLVKYIFTPESSSVEVP